MITSAEEFIRIRTSDSKEEQDRATHDAAEPGVWNDIISKYPEFKTWVLHNKTVPLEILSALVKDPDPLVREAVARKRPSRIGPAISYSLPYLFFSLI